MLDIFLSSERALAASTLRKDSLALSEALSSSQIVEDSLSDSWLITIFTPEELTGLEIGEEVLLFFFFTLGEWPSHLLLVPLPDALLAVCPRGLWDFRCIAFGEKYKFPSDFRRVHFGENPPSGSAMISRLAALLKFLSRAVFSVNWSSSNMEKSPDDMDIVMLTERRATEDRAHMVVLTRRGPIAAHTHNTHTH